MIMQGLTAQTSAVRKYLSIKKGMFFYKCEETEHEAFQEKVSEFQGTTHIHRGLWFSKLEDTITKVELHDGTYGMQIMITTSLGYVIQIKWDSRYGVHLMEKIVNDKLDLSKTITLQPYDFENEGKKIQGLNIIQDGEKISSAYFDAETKKEADGFPKVPEAKNGKKITSVMWKNYFTARNGHLMELFDEWLDKQSFSAETKASASGDSLKSADVEQLNSAEGVEDLPF